MRQNKVGPLPKKGHPDILEENKVKDLTLRALCNNPIRVVRQSKKLPTYQSLFYLMREIERCAGNVQNMIDDCLYGENDIPEKELDKELAALYLIARNTYQVHKDNLFTWKQLEVSFQHDITHRYNRKGEEEDV